MVCVTESHCLLSLLSLSLIDVKHCESEIFDGHWVICSSCNKSERYLRPTSCICSKNSKFAVETIHATSFNLVRRICRQNNVKWLFLKRLACICVSDCATRFRTQIVLAHSFQIHIPKRPFADCTGVAICLLLFTFGCISASRVKIEIWLKLACHIMPCLHCQCCCQ